MTNKAPMPQAIEAGGAGVLNGIFYSVGGFDGTNYVSTVDAYDPAANHWTPQVSMPTARGNPAVCVVNGVLSAIGGLDGTHAVDIVEAFTP